MHQEHSITVIVSDSSTMGCELLADRLRRARFQVTACFASSSDLVQGIKELGPDVALISAHLREGRLAGFDVLGQLRSEQLKPKPVMLLEEPEQELIVSAFRGLARGVFFRADPFGAFVKCIKAVDAGQIWASTRDMDYLLEALSSAIPLRPANLNSTRLQLTKRENEIAQLVAQGLTNREIAKRLYLSEHTVKNYLFRIFDKLKVSNRVELALNNKERSAA